MFLISLNYYLSVKKLTEKETPMIHYIQPKIRKKNLLSYLVNCNRPIHPESIFALYFDTEDVNEMVKLLEADLSEL